MSHEMSQKLQIIHDYTFVLKHIGVFTDNCDNNRKKFDILTKIYKNQQKIVKLILEVSIPSIILSI